MVEDSYSMECPPSVSDQSKLFVEIAEEIDEKLHDLLARCRGQAPSNRLVSKNGVVGEFGSGDKNKEEVDPQRSYWCNVTQRPKIVEESWNPDDLHTPTSYKVFNFTPPKKICVYANDTCDTMRPQSRAIYETTQKRNKRRFLYVDSGDSKEKASHRGVYKGPGGKWAASITRNRKTYYLGLYGSEVEAAQVVERAAKEYEGEKLISLPETSSEMGISDWPPTFKKALLQKNTLPTEPHHQSDQMPTPGVLLDSKAAWRVQKINGEHSGSYRMESPDQFGSIALKASSTTFSHSSTSNVNANTRAGNNSCTAADISTTFPAHTELLLRRMALVMQSPLVATDASAITTPILLPAAAQSPSLVAINSAITTMPPSLTGAATPGASNRTFIRGRPELLQGIQRVQLQGSCAPPPVNRSANASVNYTWLVEELRKNANKFPSSAENINQTSCTSESEKEQPSFPSSSGNPQTVDCNAVQRAAVPLAQGFGRQQPRGYAPAFTMQPAAITQPPATKEVFRQPQKGTPCTYYGSIQHRQEYCRSRVQALQGGTALHVSSQVDLHPASASSIPAHVLSSSEGHAPTPMRPAATGAHYQHKQSTSFCAYCCAIGHRQEYCQSRLQAIHQGSATTPLHILSQTNCQQPALSSFGNAQNDCLQKHNLTNMMSTTAMKDQMASAEVQQQQQPLANVVEPMMSAAVPFPVDLPSPQVLEITQEDWII